MISSTIVVDCYAMVLAHYFWCYYYHAAICSSKTATAVGIARLQSNAPRKHRKQLPSLNRSRPWQTPCVGFRVQGLPVAPNRNSNRVIGVQPLKQQSFFQGLNPKNDARPAMFGSILRPPLGSRLRRRLLLAPRMVFVKELSLSHHKSKRVEEARLSTT